MTAPGFGSFFSATRRSSSRNRPVDWRLGPFWASESFDAGPIEFAQTLEVVSACHRRHRNARSCLGLGDAPLAPLPAYGKPMVATSFLLDLVAPTLLFELRFACLRRAAAVGVDIVTSVARIVRRIEVLTPLRFTHQTFDRLQAEITALKAKHTAICEANAALMPATLERVFTEEH